MQSDGPILADRRAGQCAPAVDNILKPHRHALFLPDIVLIGYVSTTIDRAALYQCSIDFGWEMIAE